MSVTLINALREGVFTGGLVHELVFYISHQQMLLIFINMKKEKMYFHTIIAIAFTCVLIVEWLKHRDVYYLRHSGSMHFSTWSNSSVQSPSSMGDLSMRCRVLSPFPQVTLQSLQSDHGVNMHGIVSVHNPSQ